MCEKEFMGSIIKFCSDCLWWIRWYRKHDAPKGIAWEYGVDKFYVDANNNILPDKYFKERVTKKAGNKARP